MLDALAGKAQGGTICKGKTGRIFIKNKNIFDKYLKKRVNPHKYRVFAHFDIVLPLKSPTLFRRFVLYNKIKMAKVFSKGGNI
ncbi:MAG: hypothetical protein RR576_10855 [Oscillospiraceae bacterium]